MTRYDATMSLPAFDKAHDHDWFYTVDYGWVLVGSVIAPPDVRRILRARDWSGMSVPEYLLFSSPNRAADAAQRAKPTFGETLQQLKERL